MLMSNENKPADPTYYVYVLIDPRNDQPFYVGKGKDDRVRRHYYNWSSIDKSNLYKSRKIKKLQRMGYEPRYEILFESENENAIFKKEKELIAEWGRVGIDKEGILTNINPGGEGNTGGQRQVKQYNLFGEYIQTFSSCLEAIEFFGKKNSSSIIECCKKKGGRKATLGYFWAYAEEELDLDWCFGGKKRPIYQWDLNGNFVDRFVNAYQAANCLQKPKSSKEILRCARKGGSCQNFQWTFTNQTPGKYIKNESSHPKSIKVIQWSVNGEFIREYKSLYQANLALNKPGRDNEISRGIKLSKVTYGFRWSLVY